MAGLYNSKWQRAREAFLSANPLCVFHARRGATVAATVVDHVVAHKGDLKLFWDRKNWQALCKHCHDSHKQRAEKSGGAVGCSLSGIPLDANHHWNRPAVDGCSRPLNLTGMSAAMYERTYPLDLKPSLPKLVIVCGAPGSGKSTYVEARRGAGDVVICLDSIAAAIQGCDVHQHDASVIGRALDVRNAMLRSLSSDSVHSRAWFIVSAPRGVDRDWWKKSLGAESVVLLKTSEAECVRRIKSDSGRGERRHESCQWVRKWWQSFTE